VGDPMVALDGLTAAHVGPDHVHEVGIVVEQSPQGRHVVLVPRRGEPIRNLTRHLRCVDAVLGHA